MDEVGEFKVVSTEEQLAQVVIDVADYSVEDHSVGGIAEAA